MRRTALPVALALLLTSGCGTRLGHQQIAAGADGGTVRLSPTTIAALRQAGTPGSVRDPIEPPRSASQVRASPLVPRIEPSIAPGPRVASERRTVAAPTTRPTPAAAACARPLDPVAIGQVGTFSGVAGSITASARRMLAVWATDLNARGGLACHRVVLYSEDDGGDSSRAAAEVAELVSTHKVAALVASFVPLSMGGFRPAVEAARVPAIGGDLGTDAWFSSPWFFPQGASGEDRIIGLIRNGVETGHRRLGALYCVEATACADGIKTIRDHAAKAAGAELVYDAAVSFVQPDFTAQCLNARDAHVDQLLLDVDGASITRVARSCAAIGYRPLFSTIAGVLSPAQAQDETLRSFGVATASSEAPFSESDEPGLRSYREALRRYAPNMEPDGASVIAWTSAKLLEAAVARVAGTGPITSTSVVEGLGAIHDETLDGLTAPLSFSPGQHHATSSGCVFYELLGVAGWTAPRGSRPICLPR